jgi:hypothetical protein
MANIKGLISQLTGAGRGAAGGRPASGRSRGVAGGTRGGAAGGTRNRDEAIGRGIRKLVSRGRR